MMPKKYFTPLVTGALILALLSAQASACTLWAAAGQQAGGGTLLAKNRDWKPDHNKQTLKYSRPSDGFAWFGLYTSGDNDPGIKAGVNEHGLSVVTAAASSIPKKLRMHQPGKHGVISQILARFASVDELVANADRVFAGSRPMFLLVADREKVLQAEIGPGGEFVFHSIAQGSVAHTNHYLGKDLAIFNSPTGRSSATRLARINALLDQAPRPYTLKSFATMSRDRNAGPDDSLWRSGKEHTQASWMIESPPNGAPTLRVVIANPGETEKTHTYTLDEAFWKKKPN